MRHGITKYERDMVAFWTAKLILNDEVRTRNSSLCSLCWCLTTDRGFQSRHCLSAYLGHNIFLLAVSNSRVEPCAFLQWRWERRVVLHIIARFNESNLLRMQIVTVSQENLLIRIHSVQNFSGHYIKTIFYPAQNPRWAFILPLGKFWRRRVLT